MNRSLLLLLIFEFMISAHKKENEDSASLWTAEKITFDIAIHYFS